MWTPSAGSGWQPICLALALAPYEQSVTLINPLGIRDLERHRYRRLHNLDARLVLSKHTVDAHCTVRLLNA